jgi:hypothetical protein
MYHSTRYSPDESGSDTEPHAETTAHSSGETHSNRKMAANDAGISIIRHYKPAIPHPEEVEEPLDAQASSSQDFAIPSNFDYELARQTADADTALFVRVLTEDDVAEIPINRHNVNVLTYPAPIKFLAFDDHNVPSANLSCRDYTITVSAFNDPKLATNFKRRAGKYLKYYLSHDDMPGVKFVRRRDLFTVLTASLFEVLPKGALIYCKSLYSGAIAVPAANKKERQQAWEELESAYMANRLVEIKWYPKGRTMPRTDERDLSKVLNLAMPSSPLKDDNPDALRRFISQEVLAKPSVEFRLPEILMSEPMEDLYPKLSKPLKAAVRLYGVWCSVQEQQTAQRAKEKRRRQRVARALGKSAQAGLTHPATTEKE